MCLSKCAPSAKPRVGNNTIYTIAKSARFLYLKSIVRAILKQLHVFGWTLLFFWHLGSRILANALELFPLLSLEPVSYLAEQPVWCFSWPMMACHKVDVQVQVFYFHKYLGPGILSATLAFMNYGGT